MKILSTLILLIFTFSINAQCPTCGNGVIDVGETNLNCPQDIAHGATCTSPCAQSTAFEATAGIRTSLDFVGNTTYSTAGLPAGWAFGSGPTATTAGTLAAAGVDAYGAKGGLIQPNCSGSCVATNGFCIGNIANNQAVGAGGSSGKLGANFDGRANVAANLSYAVLRGQGNPTLVSETYNFSAVEGFKIQFWLSASESSCGQTNGWGSCVGNNAFLDFSANGGTSWTQIMTINTSSSNSDMCTNNSTNTLWLSEGRWGRVCLTVFKNTTSPGNFYPAAKGTTAASGMMLSNTWFTASFKFRIRYVQTASCTSGITATNPGRYLAIDYPVVTSGNQMIPCGISFAKYCGYGEDNNDDGVGSSLTTTNIVFGTTRRSVNHAERGVEIFNSQTAAFTSQNLTGSNFATDFHLCNAEGGDKQCIDWRSNNNFYTVVYECVADWEASTGGGMNGINVQYYEGTTPQSTGMSKVTTAGRTALIGWRYSAFRFVSCSSASSDLNPGCNGYHFQSGSLPTQFNRGFYALATNGLGESWSFYGATSCSHYFNGPFFAPIIEPTVNTEGDFTVCSTNDLVFSANTAMCSSGGAFSGSPTLDIVGPGGFSTTVASGAIGTAPITIPGDYTITANTPTSPAQCIDCGYSTCITLTQADIDACVVLVGNNLEIWTATKEDNRRIRLFWQVSQPQLIHSFQVQRSVDGQIFEPLADILANDATTQYGWLDNLPIEGNNYYRLVIDYKDNSQIISNILAETLTPSTSDWIFPNPAKNQISVFATKNAQVDIFNIVGEAIISQTFNTPTQVIDISTLGAGTYIVRMRDGTVSKYMELIVVR